MLIEKEILELNGKELVFGIQQKKMRQCSSNILGRLVERLPFYRRRKKKYRLRWKKNENLFDK